MGRGAPTVVGGGRLQGVSQRRTEPFAVAMRLCRDPRERVARRHRNKEIGSRPRTMLAMFPSPRAILPAGHCRKVVRPRAFGPAILALALAVSAAAQDSDSDRDMRRLLARPGRLLFREELRGNCAGLTVTIKTHIDRLRELQQRAKKEREEPSATLFGERQAAVNFAKERDRVEALNVVLDAKGCNPVNIEEELKKTPPAAPGKDAGKSGYP